MLIIFSLRRISVMAHKTSKLIWPTIAALMPRRLSEHFTFRMALQAACPVKANLNWLLLSNNQSPHASKPDRNAQITVCGR
jgi:hypothetical protein